MFRSLLASYLLATALIATSAVARGQQQAIPAAQLQKLKAATVFVKAAAGDIESSGSGFVVYAGKTFGLIATNYHVIAAPQVQGSVLFGRPPDTPVKVTVVFDSGTPKDWTAMAEVVYESADDDLALLLVKADKPIPEPVTLTGADKLPETTAVYVCGFPFGDALAAGAKNPEVSIGQASVSSNRTDAKGEVAVVQLNGALNPGNSGGPVVTSEGKLVGVATSTVRGAGIGFAVPAAKVRDALNDAHFSTPVILTPAGGRTGLSLEVGVVDLLGRLKSVELSVAPAITRKPPEKVLSLPNATALRVTATADRAKYSADVPKQVGAYFWLQVTWTLTDGKARDGPALLVPGTAPVRGAMTYAPLPIDTGFRGLQDDSGRPLPPLATMPGPIPDGVTDEMGIRSRAFELTGKEATTEVRLMSLAAPEREGGRVLDVDHLERERRQKPSLEFVVDKAVYERLKKTGYPGGPLIVRVKGTVGYAADEGRRLFVIDNIELIDLAGKPASLLAREEPAVLLVPPQPGMRGSVNPVQERAAYQAFRDTPTTTLHKEQKQTLIVTDLTDETLTEPIFVDRSFKVKRLAVKNMLGEPLDFLRLYASEELGEKVQAAIRASEHKAVCGELHFRLREFVRDDKLLVGTVLRFYYLDAEQKKVYLDGPAADLGSVRFSKPNIPPKPAALPKKSAQVADFYVVAKDSPKRNATSYRTINLIVTGASEEMIPGVAGDVKVRRLTITELDGRPVPEIKLYATPELYERLAAATPKADKIYAAVSIRSLRLDAAEILECAVDEITVYDEKFTRPGWVGKPTSPVLGARPTRPPAAALAGGDSPADPGRVRAPLAGGDDEQAISTERQLALIGLTAVLVGLIGLVIYRLSSPATKKKAAGDRSRRIKKMETDDDWDEDDRPKRRRRRPE